MGEKGSLKNRTKEWKNRKRLQKLQKQKNKLEQEKKEKVILDTKKKEEDIVIQSFSMRLKNGLKFSFGILFAVVEKIFTTPSKKEQKIEIILEQPKEQEKIEILELEENEQKIEKSEEQKKEKIEEPKENLEEKDPVDKAHELMKEMDEFIQKLETTFVATKAQRNEQPKKDVIEQPTVEHVIEEKKETSLNLSLKQERMHKEVVNITKKIEEIDNKIDDISISDDDIKERRKDILEVKGEVFELKNRYALLVSENGNRTIKGLEQIEKIDPYNLRYSGKEINYLLQKCDKELSKIKEEKNPKFYAKKQDLDKLKISIEENLKEQQLDIEEIKRKFNEAGLDKKRGTFVTGIHKFLSKTINIGISLLPLTICKNKLIGILGSTVVLNNRLRNMRKIIRKENQNINYIAYKDLLENLKTQKSCIEKLEDVIKDSMHQLESLKQEFILEFYYDMDRYPEVEDIMTEFSSIEYQLRSKSMELEKNLETIEKVEKNGKQKVKVME